MFIKTISLFTLTQGHKNFNVPVLNRLYRRSEISLGKTRLGCDMLICYNEGPRWLRYLRVVPVEGEPVEAFQLVFPECVAVPVFPGALQLFPVSGRGPILDTVDCHC